MERGGRDDEKYIISHRPKSLSEKQYLTMVGLKTVSLFKASCLIGAICAKASKQERQAITRYGSNLGFAFQITDDILDVFGDTKTFGKEVGKDIKERKGK